MQREAFTPAKAEISTGVYSLSLPKWIHQHGDREVRVSLLQRNIHREVGANVEGNGGGHGDGHKAPVALRQHISETADSNRAHEEARAQRHAVLRQRLHPLWQWQRSVRVLCCTTRLSKSTSGLGLMLTTGLETLGRVPGRSTYKTGQSPTSSDCHVIQHRVTFEVSFRAIWHRPRTTI